MDNRVKITPCTCVSHDKDHGRLKVELEIPGVDKKDIKLDMKKDSFCISAPRSEDTEYSGWLMRWSLTKPKPDTKAASSKSSPP